MKIAHLLKHSIWIAQKDLLEFSRNRMLLVMLIIFPLFMMVLTGYIFPTGSTLKDMPIALVNQDINDGVYGNESVALIVDLEEMGQRSGYFDFRTTGSESEARDLITKGRMSGAVIIGHNFTKDIGSGKQGPVTVLYDQSKPQISLQVMAALDSAISRTGTLKAASTVNRTIGLDKNASSALVTPFKVSNKGTVPGNPSYFQFLAPGIMMLLVMFSVMQGLPRAISHEKETGTFDGILAAPTSRFSIIMGKTLAQSVRGMTQGGIVLLLAIVLFGVTVNGPLWLVIGLLLLGIFSFIGVGITITSIASDEETAQMFMMLLQFPMMFLSGVFFPVEQMPWYMQYASKALPLTYAIQAMRKVIVLGAGVQDILTEVVILFGFGTVLLFVAIPLFKRAMSK
ncbi:MAG: ABC transporter permease [Candidatus Thermoplasmatota archaeon]|jgi:ABC-2 type transport system permease protein|nr:ABC transporter permease [Candidatus Thermoplasmatota archaeon]